MGRCRAQPGPAPGRTVEVRIMPLNHFVWSIDPSPGAERAAPPLASWQSQGRLSPGSRDGAVLRTEAASAPGQEVYADPGSRRTLASPGRLGLTPARRPSAPFTAPATGISGGREEPPARQEAACVCTLGRPGDTLPRRRYGSAPPTPSRLHPIGLRHLRGVKNAPAYWRVHADASSHIPI